MKKEELMDRHSRWSSVVLICIIALAAIIGITDIIFDFGFSKNMYLLVFILSGAILGVSSVIWIYVLNRQNKTEKEPPSPVVIVPEEKKVSISDIEYCIRKEGYIPVRKDNYVSFKISGEEVEIFYENDKLSIIRTYGIGEDVNLEVLSKACSMLHDTTFLIRSSIHTYEDNPQGLVFEVQSLVASPTELERFFERYLNVLYHGIQRHREIYGKLLEEQETKDEHKPAVQQRESKVLS